MGLFGWSYPPGCSGPPDDSYPEYPEMDEVCAILEKAGCSQDAIDEVCEIVTNLCVKADAQQECPHCTERMLKEEKEAEKALELYWDEMGVRSDRKNG